MGFPTWTLIGMAVSILAALLAVGMALLGQSPGTLRRLNMDGVRLGMRVRTYTGWGFSFILLAIGFFLAGVPLDSQVEPAAGQLPQATSAEDVIALSTPLTETELEEPLETATVRSTVSTGAFGQPSEATGAGSTPTSPVAEFTATAEIDATGTLADPNVDTPTPSRTTAPTATPTETLAPTQTLTPTPSATPTQTPSPTLTPTPVEGDTALIATNGSTLWVRRTPGGAPLVIVRDSDLVLLLAGHANQGGIEWQEVQTLEGFRGWVQNEFLVFE